MNSSRSPAIAFRSRPIHASLRRYFSARRRLSRLARIFWRACCSAPFILFLVFGAEALRKFLGSDITKAEFTIEGHSDPTGTAAYNQVLSERRAEAVKAWFVANLHLSPERLTTVGYGASRPAEGVPLDGTIEEMQGHRRTEIVIRRAKK